MKKIIVGLFLVSFASLTHAGIAQQCGQFTAAAPSYAVKAGDQEICHKNYAVIHSCSAKAPVAVFEHLTPAAINGGFKRKDDFRPDPLVTPNCSATLADYSTVGKTHDRGHMAPAGNNTQSADIMSESFFLSNMVAQVANNNRGIWKQAETFERQWALQVPNSDFYIISGGIFDNGHAKTGNGLGIPTRLYKIVYEKNSKKVTAWLMPNTALPVKDLPMYQTSVNEIEKATGIKFNLPLAK